MLYALLIYGDERAREELSETERATDFQAWMDYSKWLSDKGWMRQGEALHPVSQATKVVVRDGEHIVTDGPFAETKEQFGGYYVIDVEHLDEAIEAAAGCPGAAYGTIEVRPVMVFDQGG